MEILIKDIRSTLSIEKLKTQVLECNLDLTTVCTRYTKTQKRLLKALEVADELEEFTLIRNYQEYRHCMQTLEREFDSESDSSPVRLIIYQPTSWLEWGEDLSIDISCNDFAASILLIDNSLAASYISDATWIMDEKGDLEEVTEECLC